MGGNLNRRKTWRCFFCNEVFRSRRSAWLHFGEYATCDDDIPACVDPLRHDEKARMEAIRGANDYAKQCQDETMAAETKLEIAESQLNAIEAFFGTSSIWIISDRFKNLEFEVKMWREHANAEKIQMGVCTGNDKSST